MSSNQCCENQPVGKDKNSKLCRYDRKGKQKVDPAPASKIQRNRKLMRTLSEHDFSDVDLFYVTKTYPDFFREEALEEAQKQLEAKNMSLESLNVHNSEGLAEKVPQNRRVSDKKNKDFDMSGVLQAFDM